MVKQYMQLIKEASTTIQHLIKQINTTGQSINYWAVYEQMLTNYGLSKKKYDEILEIYVVQESIIIKGKEIIPTNKHSNSKHRSRANSK